MFGDPIILASFVGVAAAKLGGAVLAEAYPLRALQLFGLPVTEEDMPPDRG